jgi:hypothetical protein
MARRNVSQADVERIVANPTRGTFTPPARDIIEHFGYAADGRSINVVTNRAENLIISVVEQ